MPTGKKPDYQARVALREGEAKGCRRREEWFSNLRLASFLGALASAFVAWGSGGAWWALPLLLLVGFGLFVALYDRVHRRRRRAERGAAYLRDRLARMDGGRPLEPDPGLDLVPPEHPYALHLDIFGEGSLFERIVERGSLVARETLARWLLAPAPPEEVTLRQQAIEELRERLDLREEIATLDRVLLTAIDGGGVAAWADASPGIRADAHRRGSLALVGVTLSMLLLHTLSLLPLGLFLIAALVQLLYSQFLRGRVRAILKAAKGPLLHLSRADSVIRRLREEPLASGRLVAIREALAEAEALTPLLRQSERLDWCGNQFFLLFAPLLLWKTRGALALEAWRAEHGGKVADWLAAAGEFEALLALAAYAAERPDDCWPGFSAEGPLLDAPGVAHPLLPEAAVANDVCLDGTTRVLVITGSNMSGKSTLLRSVGVAVVLAQAGAPVRARSCRLSPLRVAASVQTVDSLRGGASRFYAELQAIRRAVSLAEAGEPTLFLLDELLHGTNSHDREVGAREVVRGLVERGAIGLLTTHDLALARIPDLLGERARNVHFQSALVAGELEFDYTLREGVVEGSNALELMHALGLVGARSSARKAP